jgi:hydrogenase maturation protein HypF
MRERRLIEIEGTVQGVGFRPYVHRLAAARDLRGFVRNDSRGVHIDVEGERSRLDAFCEALTGRPPAHAAITAVRVTRAAMRSYDDFRIASSSVPDAPTSGQDMPPDIATCAACLDELFDCADRRFGHAFIACTDCGPRYTIVRGSPFDRERTSMSGFARCSACEREFHDPTDRRFHAVVTSCPNCGPTLTATGGVTTLPTHQSTACISDAVDVLMDGGIVALKAIGGFQLACDATNANAVAKLRRRKHRPAKPFGVMVRDADAAATLCHLSPAEASVLVSAARPIVLARRRDASPITASVAPGTNVLGVMLPSSPLHHLLLAACARPLVMTSGNAHGDPVEIDARRAFTALGDIADLFLSHDREIVSRADDSVIRVIAEEPMSVRRARGYVPRPFRLPAMLSRPVLAVGGHQKNTICLADGVVAHLSAHHGDLGQHGALQEMRESIDATCRATGIRPQALAHDLHPDYASTRVALDYASAHAIARRIQVQHHHAHVAACLAEHGTRQPVIGVVFDGAGLGTDGAIWGGEFLVVDRHRFTRCGHLAYVPLPGGDAAARHPWRTAAAHVAGVRASGGAVWDSRPPTISDTEWRLVQHAIASVDRTPRTSSVGRLFDAVASLVDLCHVASFEGEAAMALESLADGRIEDAYPVMLSGGDTWTADPGTVIEGVLTDLRRGRNVSEIAGAFHQTMSELVLQGCERVRASSGLDTVVLSGGVFVNALLTATAVRLLTMRGFRVLLPRQVPCNDGGLALGQAYVASCALEEELCA